MGRERRRGGLIDKATRAGYCNTGVRLDTSLSKLRELQTTSGATFTCEYRAAGKKELISR